MDMTLQLQLELWNQMDMTLQLFEIVEERNLGFIHVENLTNKLDRLQERALRKM